MPFRAPRDSRDDGCGPWTAVGLALVALAASLAAKKARKTR